MEITEKTLINDCLESISEVKRRITALDVINDVKNAHGLPEDVHAKVYGLYLETMESLDNATSALCSIL